MKRRIKVRKPYRYVRRVKGFYSLKYRKKFRDFTEFSKYDSWVKRLVAGKTHNTYKGRNYPARGTGLLQVKRPFTTHFRKDRLNKWV